MLRLLMVIFLGFGLGGCNNLNLKNTIFTNQLPDEYGVEKQNILVIPKKFDLPVPVNDASAIDKKKMENINKDNLSAGEKSILEKTQKEDGSAKIYDKLDKKPNILERIF